MRTPVVAASSAAVLVLGATPAMAAAPTQTRVTISVVGDLPKIVGDEVLVAGRLQRQDGSGVAGKSLRITAGSRYVDNVTTTSTGSYSLSAPAPGSGAWKVTFEPTASDTLGGSSNQTSYYSLKYRTRVTGFSAGPRTVAYGSPTTVHGHVDKIGVPSPFPLTNSRVVVQWSRDRRSWSWQRETTSNGSGDFTFRHPANTDGYWRAVLPAESDHLGSVSSASGLVDVKYRSKLTLDARPEPVRKGKTLSIKGTLAYVGAGGRLHGVGGLQIRVYFKPYKAKKAVLLGTIKTGKGGAYTFKFRPARGGTYTATWAGNASYLPTGSGGDYVGVRR